MKTSNPRTLTFLSYAVNGRGVGHLTRQVAIQKWLRRLCAVLGVESRHYFLTTSEADQVATEEGFAAFKLPSKTAAVDAGLGKPRYIGLAKQWVWHSLALLRPDTVLVDTFPEGSFHELPSALDLAGHRVLVLRPVKSEFAASPAFRAAVDLYDQVYVPTSSLDGDELGSMSALDDLDQLEATGPIILTEDFERLAREDARRELGVTDPSALVLLVTGGGGGDDTVPEVFARARALVEDRPEVHLVLAAGPLYRGPAIRGPRVTWLATPGLSRMLRAVDLAVSACGFNTAHELMSAAVPTLFVPQPKIADDQAARAARFARAGAAAVASPDDLGGALRSLLDDATARARLASGAGALGLSSAAREVAAGILATHVAPARVEDALDAITPRVLEAEVPLEALAGLARALSPDRVDLEAAVLVFRAADAHGFPRERLPRLATLLARRIAAPPPRLAALLARLLAHPLVTGQSATLLSLVQLLTRAKADVDEVERELLETLDACLAGGRGLGALVRAVAEEPETERPIDASFLVAVRDRLERVA